MIPVHNLKTQQTDWLETQEFQAMDVQQASNYVPEYDQPKLRIRMNHVQQDAYTALSHMGVIQEAMTS